MSVNNGDIANASTFNNAFVSRSANQNVAGTKEFDSIALTAETNSATGDVVALSYTNNNIRLASADSILGVASAASAKVLTLSNVSGGNITIGDESASAAATNRIVTGLSQDFTLPNGAVCFLLRDTTSNRWRILNAPAEGSNSGRLIAVNTYTASASFTKASNNPNFVIVEVQGGGGGGGGASTTTSGETSEGGGGSAGGYSKKFILASSLSASETVTVGSGGAGGSAGENDGSSGGTSSFGAHCSATGGGGGTGAADYSTHNADGFGANGSGSGGDLNINGGPGGIGSGSGGIPRYANQGGDSVLGFGGFANGPTAAGGNGIGYGSGGSGGRTRVGSAVAGGNGAAGIVIVWEYA